MHLFPTPTPPPPPKKKRDTATLESVPSRNDKLMRAVTLLELCPYLLPYQLAIQSELICNALHKLSCTKLAVVTRQICDTIQTILYKPSVVTKLICDIKKTKLHKLAIITIVTMTKFNLN